MICITYFKLTVQPANIFKNLSECYIILIAGICCDNIACNVTNPYDGRGRNIRYMNIKVLDFMILLKLFSTK